MRHHTLDPIKPVAGVAPVAAISLHGRSVAARLMLRVARQFYWRQLREKAKTGAHEPLGNRNGM
jgi:hypothetical protein